jgi:hypothetical protein
MVFGVTIRAVMVVIKCLFPNGICSFKKRARKHPAANTISLNLEENSIRQNAERRDRSKSYMEETVTCSDTIRPLDVENRCYRISNRLKRKRDCSLSIDGSSIMEGKEHTQTDILILRTDRKLKKSYINFHIGDPLLVWANISTPISIEIKLKVKNRKLPFEEQSVEIKYAGDPSLCKLVSVYFLLTPFEQ